MELQEILALAEAVKTKDVETGRALCALVAYLMEQQAPEQKTQPLKGGANDAN